LSFVRFKQKRQASFVTEIVVYHLSPVLHSLEIFYEQH